MRKLRRRRSNNFIIGLLGLMFGFIAGIIVCADENPVKYLTVFIAAASAIVVLAVDQFLG